MGGTCRTFLISIIALSIFNAVSCDRPDDCTEVGFARAGGSVVVTAFQEVKEAVVARWREEDERGVPAYTRFPGSLKNSTRAAYLLEEVSKEVLARIRKTRIGKRCKEEWILRGVEKHVTPIVNLDSELAETLQLAVSFRCMIGSPYPNVDGTCVSEESPDLGANGAKFLRLLASSSSMDGFSIRGSVAEGQDLPNARAVSSTIRKLLKKPTNVTPLFAAWAHFLQMDVFSIPESPATEGVDCCKTPEAEDCAAIEVPEADELHSQQTCINFRRSAKAQAILGHRESLSLVSTYLDATPLYGSTNEEAFKKKTGFFGLLKGSEKLEGSEGKCGAPDSFDGCFDQEDETYKIAPSLHALLMLEHNRIADELAVLNPHFDDALLYNEARRILIAQYYALTYGYYLETLMGTATVDKHMLRPGNEGPGNVYMKEVIPGVLTSFAVAAFRNPAMATEWHSSSTGREEVFGSSHYDTVAELPYQDLLALDVQRARDHGLTGYLAWRRFCEPGLVLDTWEDLSTVLPADAAGALKDLYRGEMEDIDAMAALLEPPMEGGVAGKTFTCIMADQFARLKTGNRLYWEHEGAALTHEQKEAIKSVTVAALLCANLPLDSLPTNPLLPVSDQNPSIKCSDVKQLDLKQWTDTSLIESMKAAKKKDQKMKESVSPSSPAGESTEDSTEQDSSEECEDSSSTTKEEPQESESGHTSTPELPSRSDKAGSPAPDTVETREGDPTASLAGVAVDTPALPLTTASKEEL